MVTVGLHRQSVRLKLENDRARRNGETAIGMRYAMQRLVLWPRAEYSATGVSLTALTERVHSDGAIPPGRKYFLLMRYDRDHVARHIREIVIL